MRAVLGAVALAAAALVAGPSAAAWAADGATEVCRFSDDRLNEISGMTMSVRHPGVLWLHNDSSGGPFIYAVDSTTCATLARVRIGGIPARDIEAIASGRDRQGRPVLWIADIGDNRDNWPEVRLHRVREPERITDTTVRARTYRVTYSDRPHNAEALLADPNSSRVWIVTRQLAHGSLYALPEPLRRGRVNVAEPLRIEGGLITDGAVSPDGTRYVLRDYVNAVVFDGLPPGAEAETILLPFQPQGEAVTWTADGRSLLVASERDGRLMLVPVTTPPAPESAAAASPATSTPAAPQDGGVASTGGGADWLVPVGAAALVVVAGAGIAIARMGRGRRRDASRGSPGR
ncbi:MAG: hypothetical protein IPO93_01945 [Actinobacteria bacterium]|nr:hypothetical protein [Actinomycetota bacterium]